MSAPTLVAGSLLGLVVAGLWGSLAILQLRRAAAPGQEPRRLFAVFWAGIAAHILVESANALAVGLGVTSLSLGLAALLLKMGTGLVAFFGLVSYMLVVYSGDQRVAQWVALFYAALVPFVLFAYLSRVPVAVEARVWYAGLAYVHAEGLVHAVMVVLLFLPPLACTLCYLLLVRVSDDPAQRRRIVLTSLALSTFFAAFLLGWMNERWYWWGLLERLLAIGASLAVLHAEGVAAREDHGWAMRAAT